MSPLSSPVVTFIRLSIVTVGLTLTVFAVLPTCHGQTDRRTDGSGLAKGDIMH